MRRLDVDTILAAIITMTALAIALANFGANWALGSLGVIALTLVVILLSRRARKVKSAEIVADATVVSSGDDHDYGWRESRWVSFVMLVAAAGGIAVALLGLNTVRSLGGGVANRPSATIVSPREGQPVAREIRVEGRSVNRRRGQQIWIAVVPGGSTRFYPQNGSADIQADGAWISPPVFLGDLSDTGSRGFDILALIVDPGAQKVFGDYLRGTESPGLVRLPEGTIVADTVTVVRT